MNELTYKEHLQEDDQKRKDKNTKTTQSCYLKKSTQTDSMITPLNGRNFKAQTEAPTDHIQNNKSDQPKPSMASQVTS